LGAPFHLPGPLIRHVLRPLPRRALLTALGGVVLAMGLRALLDPWLGNAVPFLLAFIALVAVQMLAGVRAAVLLVLGCLLWSQFAPVPRASPLHAFGFVAGCALFIVFIRGMLSLRADAADATAAASGGRGLRGLQLALAVLLVLPAAFFGSVTWYSHDETLREAHRRLDATTAMAGEQAARVVETNRLIAEQLAIQLGDQDDAEVRAREADWHTQLKRMAQDLRQVQSLWLWGADGRPLAGSRFLPAPAEPRVDDRDYFVACRDQTVDWHHSQVHVSRRTQERFFNVSRCRRAADGRFLGVITVSLRPEYFADFYDSLQQAEPGLRLQLLRSDGTVLVDSAPQGLANGEVGPGPSPQVALAALGAGQDLRQTLAAADGARHEVSLHRLAGTPLVVAASLSRSAALAPWQQRVAVLAFAVFPAAMATAYLTLVAMQRTRRELAALARLRQETEQRGRAEQALRQAQKLEALGQLTGGVAHDFNNLLMVIHTNAYLLARRDPALADSRALQALQRAVTSGTQLTRQLLAFAKRQPLQPQTLHLQESMPALTDLLKTSVGGRVALAVEVDPQTSPVHVDAAELELALLNLAINARDAMPDGGQLRLRAQDRDGPGGREVLIAVSDTGSGIPPSLREKVFEPFFSLSQVWGFCEQAGGRVLLDSTPGEGTTVTLVLPPAEVVAVGGPESLPAVAQPLPRRVLMAEDNEDVAQATVQLLQSLGCEVRRVASADEGLALLEASEARPDLLLSDVVMPGRLNGVGLARAVRARHPGLPVLLMTGYTQELQAALQEGFAVLAKPFDAEALTRALGEALERGC
jgi:signal transduction histidine kinase